MYRTCNSDYKNLGSVVLPGSYMQNVSESLGDFEDLQHIAIHTVLRFAAEIITDVLMYDGTRIATPYLEDAVFQFVTNALSRRAVPSAVIADMMGMSPRTYFRRKNKPGCESISVTSLILDYFIEKNGKVSIGVLREEFAGLDLRTLDSTIHHMIKTGVIRQVDGTYELIGKLPSASNIDETLVLLTIGAKAPLTVEELINSVELPRIVVERRVNHLIEQGSVRRDENGVLIGLGQQVSVSSSESTGLLLGLMLSLHAMELAIHQKLDRNPGQFRNRVMVERMFVPSGSPEIGELKELLDRFQSELRALSKRVEQMEPNDDIGVHVMLTCAYSTENACQARVNPPVSDLT